MRNQYLETGRIVATHGIRGELRVEPWADSPEFLLQFDRLYLDAGASSLRVVSSRRHKSLVVVKFEGIDTVEQAVPLLHRVVYIDRGQVTLAPGSYFEQDLIGLEVRDAGSGRVYGTLTSVSRTGANDVYGVTPAGGEEVLFPAIREVVRSVEPEQGVMTIIPLKGLFDDAD